MAKSKTVALARRFGGAAVRTVTRIRRVPVPVSVRRATRSGGINIARTGAQIGGGAAAALIYDYLPTSLTPLMRAAALGGVALILNAIPGVKQFSPGMAGAAGFVGAQALRKK